MKKKVFIQSNKKQYLGALLAKYSMEKYLPNRSDITVQIMNVDDNMKDYFKSFYGKEYFHNGVSMKYNPLDLQSFTLVRFMPPQLMGYEGRAVVIDPDIFTRVDITELFDMDLQDKAFAACPKKGSWDSSVMLLDCAKLRHWSIERIIDDLTNSGIDYVHWSALVNEKSGLPLSRIWNNLDELNDDTKMLHTTGRITQPWKTGLPIDFTRKKMAKLFGIIPRHWVHKIIGRYKTTYQEHPDKKIREFFFNLVKDALNDKAVTREQIQGEVNQGHIRPDLFDIVNGNKQV